ncbi:MAG TPA: hypothetical protein VGK19_24785 [Capsulimonadaceae bacterium]|jgi:hypothetical protein
MNKLAVTVVCLATSSIVAASLCEAQTLPQTDLKPFELSLTIDAVKTTGLINPKMLGGTNVAYWNTAATFTHPVSVGWMKDMKPSLIRIPGGSWSDGMMWNGNGVRDAKGNVDDSRIGPDGWPAIDYSGYAPSFGMDNRTLKPVAAGFHGNVDIRAIQDFVKSIGAHPYVCVNAGSGRPVDAAEWVRWTNIKRKDGAHYWEIGNELDGSWEQGHIIPKTNIELTGEMYAKKVHDFATAMKAVDPTIAIGGAATGVTPGGFTEQMLKLYGNDVDFVSIHTYPGAEGMTHAAALESLDKIISSEVGLARKYITMYQPKRADKIEIGYSEFNLRTGSSTLFSGLWMSEALSAMARNGVSFATQWDAFTHTRPMKDGHGLILGDAPYVRKAQYFAISLWNNLTGTKIVSSTLSDVSDVHTLVTRSDHKITIQFINPDKDRAANVAVNLGNFKAASTGVQTTLSCANYFWNSARSEPDWSLDPTTAKIHTGRSFSVTVPPLAVSYVVVADSPASKITTPVASSTGPSLKLLMPESVYAGDETECLVQALKPGTTQPYGSPIENATVSISGTAEIDRKTVRLAESMGRFVFKAGSPGPVTVKAQVGGQSVETTVTALSSVPRPVVFWDFTTPDVSDKPTFTADWPLIADYSVRANKAVARVDLPTAGVTTSDNSRTLLRIMRFPEPSKLNRANIRGIVFDLKTKDFSSKDPNAAVQVVMQSPNNYWIVLGSVPLAGSSEWKSHQVMLANDKQIEYMPTSYNLWFVLSASKPTTGTIYIDRAGMMVR